METPSSRLVAALLIENPGSVVMDRTPHSTLVRLAVQPAHEVLIFEPMPSAELERLAKANFSPREIGVGRSLLAIHAGGSEADQAIKSAIPFFRFAAGGGFTWVPGQEAQRVRGQRLAPLLSAAERANAPGELSLQTALTQSASDIDEIQSFLGAANQRTPFVNYAVAVACVLMFGLQWLWGGGDPVLAASRMGAEIPNRVLEHGEWWRLFSVMMLHANVMHLVLNMVAMLSFGTFLEKVIGSGRYLVLYVLSGLGGSLLSLLRGGDGIGVGASGGVWGLMLAGAVVVTWPGELFPRALAHQLRQRAWVPVAINAFYSLRPGIDMLAHLGGGIAGAVLILLLARLPGTGRGPLRKSPIFGIAGALMASLLLGSVALAFQQGNPWALGGKWALKTVSIPQHGLLLDIPEGFSPDEERTKADTWAWGNINEQGAEFFVVIPKGLTGEEDDPSVAFEQMLEESKVPYEGFRYVQAPKRVKLPSGLEVIRWEQVPNNKDDVRFLRGWWSLHDRQWVLVTANALNTSSNERRAQLEDIASSLKVAPAAREP